MAFQRPDIVKSFLIAKGNLITGGGSGNRNITTNKKMDFINTAFPELLNDVKKGASTEEWMDVLLASWSRCDVRGLY